jgi:hypothetical protein
VLKESKEFCPNAGALPLGVVKAFKDAARGLAGLRAARMVKAVRRECSEKGGRIGLLRDYAGMPDASVASLCDAVIERYLDQLAVSVQDLRSLVPFVGLGGKIPLAADYVSRMFGGSEWRALRHYACTTYAGLEAFLRQQRASIQGLNGEEDSLRRFMQRLEHAERFNDPAIRSAIEGFLSHRKQVARTAEEIGDSLRATAQMRGTVLQMLEGVSP